MLKQRTVYGFLMAGGLIGSIASFLETIEYQALLKNAHAQLTCNLNSVFSCSSVLHSWQSRIFGFPNSMLCMVFFTTMFAAGLVGLAGGTMPPKLRLWLQGVSLFFFCFAMWFMWQSTFVIQSLCILCLFCLAGLFTINWAWLRLNAEHLPGSRQAHHMLNEAIRQHGDTFTWLILALLIAFVMFMKFSH